MKHTTNSDRGRNDTMGATRRDFLRAMAAAGTATLMAGEPRLFDRGHRCATTRRVARKRQDAPRRRGQAML